VYKDIICDKKILLECYGEITKKSANLSDADIQIVKNLRQSLLDHSFTFKPIKRIKTLDLVNKVKLLNIPSICDKIVQKAMIKALQVVYNNNLSDSLYVFKSNKNPHFAIKQVTGWSGTKWFLKGDIYKSFETIDYHLLAKLLQKKIKSKEFLDLYWKAVRARYVNPLKKVDEFCLAQISGGSLISPILSSIYLDELDNFIEEKVQHSKKSGKTTTTNPDYKKVHTKISNLRQYFSQNNCRNKTFSKEQEKNRIDEILRLEKLRAKLSSVKQASKYRIYYIRYGCDFLIGVNGSQKIIEKLKKDVCNFIMKDLNLKLDIEEINLIRSDKGVIFLGSYFKRYISRTNDQPRRKNSFTLTGRKIRARFPQGSIHALAPLELIVKKLESQGICKIKHFKKRAIIPTRKTAWINLNLSSIVNKYNQIWESLLNYYSFAYNRSQLNLIQFLLQHSLACTFMNKLKLNSRSQVFKKYGQKLCIKEDNKIIYFKLQKTLKRINLFSDSPIIRNPFKIFNYSLRTKENISNSSCLICRSNENIEMHHKKPLKAHKTNNRFKSIKVNLSRKQIPLCRKCHLLVHSGKYDGLSIY